jgi:hypothetical protein
MQAERLLGHNRSPRVRITITLGAGTTRSVTQRKVTQRKVTQRKVTLRVPPAHKRKR